MPYVHEGEERAVARDKLYRVVAAVELRASSKHAAYEAVADAIRKREEVRPDAPLKFVLGPEETTVIEEWKD